MGGRGSVGVGGEEKKNIQGGPRTDRGLVIV